MGTHDADLDKKRWAENQRSRGGRSRKLETQHIVSGAEAYDWTTAASSLFFDLFIAIIILLNHILNRFFREKA